MKVLVTGKNGGISRAFRDYVLANFSDIEVDMISVRGEDWKSEDFSKYDAIYHCAGIVYNDNEDEIYRINRDLTYAIAKKAKKDGVKQFIYLSSMAVYGLESSVFNDDGLAYKDRPLKPTWNYGVSKKQAEELIFLLNDDTFKVCAVRAPSVYGKNTESYLEYYFQFLEAESFKVMFTNLKRSVIYTDNLAHFVYLLIKNKSNGVFCPQNKQMYSAAEFIRDIAKVTGADIEIIEVDEKDWPTDPALESELAELYGRVDYPYELSDLFDYEYDIVSTEESIKMCLGK